MHGLSKPISGEKIRKILCLSSAEYVQRVAKVK